MRMLLVGCLACLLLTGCGGVVSDDDSIRAVVKEVGSGPMRKVVLDIPSSTDLYIYTTNKIVDAISYSNEVFVCIVVDGKWVPIHGNWPRP